MRPPDTLLEDVISVRRFAEDRPRAASALLWLAAFALTLGAFTHQDRTGPTYPLEGELETVAGPVRFKFVRSETIGSDLPVILVDPVPAGITGRVEYRRFKSHDDWTVVPMKAGDFEFSRRGRSSSISGVGAALPSLNQRAGKYEFFVLVDDGTGRSRSVTGDRPVHARYKAPVPVWALITHIFVIFASMTFAIRAVLEAIVDGNFGWMLKATIISLILGAFVLGPLAQWYAFGVWWAGVPFGYDWTDNKVLVSLVAWGIAAFLNRGGRKNRAAVLAAGMVTLLVYFIPHSVFGSEFDYRTGKGHGTAG